MWIRGLESMGCAYQMCRLQYNLTAEFLCLISLKGTTTERDVFQAMKDALRSMDCPGINLCLWPQTVNRRYVSLSEYRLFGSTLVS